MALIALIVIANVVLLVAAFVYWWRHRPTPAPVVSARDIPRVVAALGRAGANASFAVFMFVPPGGRAGDDTVNLQYSVERGKVGLDWGLAAPRNVADEARIVDFLRGLGRRVMTLEENGFRYLRTEGPGIEDAGARIITEFYRMPVESPLELIVEGFSWPA